MRRNVKIITIYDQNPNYGNRLQNYAVQRILENLDMHVTTITFQQGALSGMGRLKYYAQKLSGYQLPGNKDYWILEGTRIITFDKFNRRFIHTERIKRISEIGKADYFVLGSDQVWNPEWYNDCVLKKDLFLLTFA